MDEVRIRLSTLFGLALTRTVEWVIPKEYGKAWGLVLNTAPLQPEADRKEVAHRLTVSARTVMVLQTR
ncbi:MAG: hypothetical protein M3077_12150 [Candidatus Dormibacteraeota bacterium]|nr:hypothetical protein [Candidatus Dormibacteraeota bacterium]